MKIYCDSSTLCSCIVIEGSSPRVTFYDKQVTNNVGEYRAVILALEEARASKWRQVEVLTDSEFVVNQVKGFDKFGHKWERCLPHLLPYRDEVRNLLREMKVELKWIPREENLAGKILG